MCVIWRRNVIVCTCYVTLCVCTMTFEHTVFVSHNSVLCFWCVFYKWTNISLTFRHTADCVYIPCFTLEIYVTGKLFISHFLLFLCNPLSCHSHWLNNRPTFCRPTYNVQVQTSHQIRSLNLQLECFARNQNASDKLVGVIPIIIQVVFHSSQNPTIKAHLILCRFHGTPTGFPFPLEIPCLRSSFCTSHANFRSIVRSELMIMCCLLNVSCQCLYVIDAWRSWHPGHLSPGARLDIITPINVIRTTHHKYLAA